MGPASRADGPRLETTLNRVVPQSKPPGPNRIRLFRIVARPFRVQIVVRRGSAGYNQPIMGPNAQILERLERAVGRRCLVETAARLIEVPSPTGAAGGALDQFGELLAADGFQLQHPEGDHAPTPALVVTHAGVGTGRTLQYSGHPDTVHLPLVPPSVEGDLLTGSGATDMRGGFATAVETPRTVRDSGLLTSGSILLTAHDLHDAPLGDGRQLDRLINDGLVGDAVLIPEPLCDRLPVVGRGQPCWEVAISRPEPPVHEVMRPLMSPASSPQGLNSWPSSATRPPTRGPLVRPDRRSVKRLRRPVPSW